MKFDVAASSEKGPRPRNEDAAGAWVVSPSRAGLVVADGVGGHIGGQRASSLALNKFHTYIAGQTLIDLEGLANTIHAEIQKLQSEDPQYESAACDARPELVVADRGDGSAALHVFGSE